ncbi:MAG: helix-turn-helix domain-containing protein [Microbacterium sp.]
MPVSASAPATLSPRRAQTRARLLDAAHEVFGEVGMDAASVELICERAGFTRGAFYSNFESKEELFLALIGALADAKMDQVAERARALAPGALDLAATVRYVAGAGIGDMEPQLIGEMRAQALRDPRLGAAFLALQEAMRARIEEVIVLVASTYELRLRLPAAEAAQLLLDVSEVTCVRAALEGCQPDEASRRMNDRLETLAGVLLELP